MTSFSPLFFLKPFRALLVFSLLWTNFLAAQVRSVPPADSATGRSAQDVRTNRLQELYDQHNGFMRKSARPALPAERPINAGVAEAVGRAEELSEPALVRNPSGTRIGVRGGVTYPIATGNNPSVASAFGFVGGLVLQVGSGVLSFQPEVNYARYSVRSKNDFTGQSITGASDLVEVPLLLKVSSGTNRGSRFFLNAGPYGAYLASTGVNGKKTAISAAEKRLRYGAAAGIGAALKTGPGHLTVELRGYYELSRPSRPAGVPVETTFGYTLPLGYR